MTTCHVAGTGSIFRAKEPKPSQGSVTRSCPGTRHRVNAGETPVSLHVVAKALSNKHIGIYPVLGGGEAVAHDAFRSAFPVCFRLCNDQQSSKTPKVSGSEGVCPAFGGR